MDDIKDVSISACESSKYIRPKRIHYTQNGITKAWDAMEVHSSVAILLFNKTRNVFVFVRQFRPAIYLASTKSETQDGREIIDTAKYPGSLGLTLELCAGIVDKQAPLEKIAREEVMEECGYQVPDGGVCKITSARGGVGTTGSMAHLFYAEVTDEMKVGAGGGLAAEGEMIDVVEMSVEEARAMMFDESVNRVHLLIFALMWFFEYKWKKES